MNKCDMCKFFPIDFNTFPCSRCIHNLEIIDRYEKKLLSFDEWYRKNSESNYKGNAYQAALNIWNASRENMELQ